MEDVKINNKILQIGSYQCDFKRSIKQVKKVGYIYILLLEGLEGKQEINNVYGVNNTGGILWRIQSPEKGMAGIARYPYVGLSVVGEIIGAVDFFGRRFEIDIKNGSILGFDIVK